MGGCSYSRDPPALHAIAALVASNSCWLRSSLRNAASHRFVLGFVKSTRPRISWRAHTTGYASARLYPQCLHAGRGWGDGYTMRWFCPAFVVRPSVVFVWGFLLLDRCHIFTERGNSFQKNMNLKQKFMTITRYDAFRQRQQGRDVFSRYIFRGNGIGA